MSAYFTKLLILIAYSSYSYLSRKENDPCNRNKRRAIAYTSWRAINQPQSVSGEIGKVRKEAAHTCVMHCVLLLRTPPTRILHTGLQCVGIGKLHLREVIINRS